MDEGVQGSPVKNEEEDKSEEEEEIAAAPLNEKVLDDSQASVLQKKVGLDAVEESEKAKRPNKVMKKLKKKLEELEDDQFSAKKKENDKAKKEEEEMVVVCMAGKELEDSESSVPKREVGIHKVEVSEKAKGPKEAFKKKLKKKLADVPDSGAIKYVAEDPGPLQESDSRVMEDSQSEEAAVCPERDADSVAALPKVGKVVDKSQDGKPKKKASSSVLVEQKEELKEMEETKKSKKLKKVLIKAKKEVEDVQEQCSGVKKEENENSKEQDKFFAVSIVEKVLEDSEATLLDCKVSLDEVDESKKAKKIKKASKKQEHKANEVQGSAAIKYDVELPELLQESDSRVTKDSQSEEVVFCPERNAECVAALLKVAKVADKSQCGKPKKKASSSHLVEQEEELKKVEETKKAKKLKKVSKKAKKKVEDVHDSVAKQAEEDKSEEVVIAVPITEKILEDSHSSVLKRKLILDTVEETKQVKRAKKLLKKSKKKVVEEKCSAAKKEEHDTSNEEDEVAVVSMDEKVLEDSQASALKSKVSLDEVEESKKAKKAKKVLKKREKKANEEQGGATIKYDVEVPELLQASNGPFTDDSQNEEVTFCPERATESVAGPLKVAKVVVESQTGKPNKKASSSHIVEQEEELLKEEVSKKAKKHKKVLKKIKKKVEEVPGMLLSCRRYVIESDSRVMKDSQSEEVAFCPERDAESVAALFKVAQMVDKSQGGKPKKKASLGDLMEQEKELKKIEETKKSKKLKKVSKNAKKKVEVVQGSVAKKEEEDKSEEVVVVVPVIKKILKDSLSSVLKRKLVLDTVEETNKVKRAKKLLKKSKKKVKEEHDKSKEQDKVAAVSMVEKVLEDSQASVLKSKVSLDEVEESKKAKKNTEGIKKAREKS
ncbi:hypothetical protein MKX03_008283 [Papaver bracteatum]|nr:hypothetical protein MKX03_008283 [Papaver bracteatum]